MSSHKATLIKPVLTEKMLRMQEDMNTYAFQVESRANKIEIQKAVEKKFNVLVEDVRTINIKGKTKRMNTRRGLTRGKRPDWKKAIITLKEGYTIDLFQEQQG